MAIYLPATADEEHVALDELTPREIVRELDKYVVGQHQAKRAVAIALRNRMRRQKLTPELAEEVIPKNIIMMGPTGVGKTEIARRLAKLANSPFLKVEASKFTEVGYVGRDVESMIRDLVEIAIDMVREEKLEDVADKAELNAEERLLDLLLPSMPTQVPPRPQPHDGSRSDSTSATSRCWPASPDRAPARSCASNCAKASSTSAWSSSTSAKSRCPAFEIITNQGVEEMDVNMKDMLPNIFGQRTKKRKMKVSEAFEYLIQEEEQRLVDMDQVQRIAVERVENSRHHLPRRDRQDCRARRRARARRFARRRAARHPAHRRRHHGEHALRHGAHRPHPVHCRRRVPRLQAQRPDSRVAGPLPHSRGAAIADGRGLHQDPHRAEVVADQAVHRAARHRRREAGVHRRGAGRKWRTSPSA